MIAQQSKNETLTHTPEIKINEEQDSRSEMMTTQMMVNGKINQDTNDIQYVVLAPATEGLSSKWANLLAQLSQVFWRVSFEVEPVAGGLFSPFTAKIRRCRGLSDRDKAELETIMKRR